MINIIAKSIELMDAIKMDNPQPIVDYFKRNDVKYSQGFMNYSLNPVYFIISELIAQDKTKLMQEMLSSEANPFTAGIIQNDVAATPVINAIIQHKHTEIVCCIIENYNFRKSFNISNCLTTAVLAENIPVMQFIKNLPEVEIESDERTFMALPIRTILKTTVDYELIQTLIDTERYDLLDMLTDNGNSLKKLEVCESILLAFDYKNIKKYLSAIAKRYLPNYEKSRNKTKALKGFLECNADLEMVGDRIFHFPCMPFSFYEEKNLPYFKLLSQLGIKTNNTDNVLSYAITAAKNPHVSTEETEQLIKYLTSFIYEDATYKFSNVLRTIGVSNNETKNSLEQFLKNAKEKPALLVDNLNGSSNISCEDIDMLMNYFNIKLDSPANINPAILDLIERNNLQIMKKLTEAGLFTSDDVKKLSKLCIKMKKKRMAEDIKKWYENSQHN